MIDMKDIKKELNSLVNQKISFIRVAGNTIYIYFFGEPGCKDVISLQINPTWRLEKDKKIVVASNDLYYFEGEEKYSEYEKRFKKLCFLFRLIKNTKLMQFRIDEISNDIMLFFSNNMVIKSFLNSINAISWIIRNKQKKIKINIASPKIELKENK